jgi:hypothetical protein
MDRQQRYNMNALQLSKYWLGSSKHLRKTSQIKDLCDPGRAEALWRSIEKDRARELVHSNKENSAIFFYSTNQYALLKEREIVFKDCCKQ